MIDMRLPLGPPAKPPVVPPQSPSLAEKLNEFLAEDPSGVYDWTVNRVLDRVSHVTQDSIGIDVGDLISVERTLFTTLAGGIEGYNGGAPPLFMALAEGQAAYVNLGPARQEEADHLMRMFAGLPLEIIEGLEGGEEDMRAVRGYLLAQARAKEFPVYVDLDGKCGPPNLTESVATESIASIARRENSLGPDFPDPRLYYRWLVTRVESNYRRLDPWLFAVKQPLHDQVVEMKHLIKPPWSRPGNQSNPFGANPTSAQAQQAYGIFATLCEGGDADVADATVALDRDLLSGIQTFLIKFFSQLSPEQRSSLQQPIARAWVGLNTQADHDLVSPPQAPEIELLNRKDAKVVRERYDRSMALGEAVDHLLCGLGLEERRQWMSTLLDQVAEQQGPIEEREQRLRQRLGSAYAGLDVGALVRGEQDIHSPGVKQALEQLVVASGPELERHSMNPDYADIIRHRDLMEWVASRYSRYGDLGFHQVLAGTARELPQEYADQALILGEFYQPAPPGTPVTPLPQLHPGQILYGQPQPGQPPLKASLVLEGGGGKGFAFAEVLKQMGQSLNQGQGQVALDEFIGNSAGAITAGLLAAGYSEAQLAEVQKELDFKKFYSDYMWLSGGVDPKVRGINRTGLFSQQKMYQTLSELLKKKCPVEGRPVLFRDLPYQLKVTSTLLNSDLPPELLQEFQLQPDGQVFFSSQTTPNMDVAAALCCSAAVPGFFNAPQLQLCHDSRTQTLHRMQLVDGGFLDNFPVSKANQEQPSFLLTLPAYHEAPNPNGGPPIALSTLNFDAGAVAQIDAYNRTRFAEWSSQLMPALQAGAEAGYGRAVIGLNLSDLNTQPAPILQGKTRQQSLDLLEQAQQVGLPTMEAEAAQQVIKGNMASQPRKLLEQHLLDALLDKNDHFRPGNWAHPSGEYRLGTQEAVDVPEMLAGVMGASLVAPSLLPQRLFER